MNDFKVGDFVYVPHAVSWIWEATLTKIEEITDTSYICDVLLEEFGSREGLVHRKIGFDKEHVFANKDDCRKYIDDYYYSGLCKGCKYDKIAGIAWDCNDCANKVVVKSEDVTQHDKFYCSKCNVCIGGTYIGRHEICKYYDPTLPQNIKEYESYEKYDDYLRNCEFNRECIHHKNSCHKTMPYERYLDKFIRIPCSFKYEERHVEAYFIKRKEWIDLSFKDDDGCFYCYGFAFSPVYNKNGSIKKGTANNVKMFENRTKIDIKKLES